MQWDEDDPPISHKSRKTRPVITMTAQCPWDQNQERSDRDRNGHRRPSRLRDRLLDDMSKNIHVAAILVQTRNSSMVFRTTNRCEMDMKMVLRIQYPCRLNPRTVNVHLQRQKQRATKTRRKWTDWGRLLEMFQHCQTETRTKECHRRSLWSLQVNEGRTGTHLQDVGRVNFNRELLVHNSAK